VGLLLFRRLLLGLILGEADVPCHPPVLDAGAVQALEDRGERVFREVDHADDGDVMAAEAHGLGRVQLRVGEDPVKQYLRVGKVDRVPVERHRGMEVGDRLPVVKGPDKHAVGKKPDKGVRLVHEKLDVFPHDAGIGTGGSLDKNGGKLFQALHGRPPGNGDVVAAFKVAADRRERPFPLALDKVRGERVKRGGKPCPRVFLGAEALDLEEEGETPPQAARETVDPDGKAVYLHLAQGVGVRRPVGKAALEDAVLLDHDALVEFRDVVPGEEGIEIAGVFAHGR